MLEIVPHAAFHKIFWFCQTPCTLQSLCP